MAGLKAGDWFNLKDKDGTPFNVKTQEQSLLYRIDGKALTTISDSNDELRTQLFADLSARKSHQDMRQAHHQNQQMLYHAVKASAITSAHQTSLMMTPRSMRRQRA